MIITSKDLNKIENAVGYDSTAGVVAGFNQGDLEIRVMANHPVTGERFTFNHIFTEEQMKFCSPCLMLDAFKNEACAIFYDEFKKPVDVPQQGQGLPDRG